ncbi:MAG TPA: tetratricopeptide repeat protein [Deltaproteobacteria bacterium]|nr:tetratricopeptide repeat protein [Deltaproteobacteria bacterium]HPR55262.1 tetratricopeptide repeat protein [Deltaproteobacteria bacterium]HXK46899.1 tetratricopeptide repeat protein [Deltaproteobacteria bacterium]
MSSIYDALKRSQMGGKEPPRMDEAQVVRGARVYWIIAAAIVISSAATVALLYGIGFIGQGGGDAPVAASPVPVSPERIIDLMNKADRLQRKEDLEGAIAAYRNVLELSPGYAEAYMRLGELYYGAGRFDEAFSAMSAAKKLKPNDARLLNNIGSVLLANDDAAQALTYFIQARRNSADYVEPLYNMACAYARLNKKGAALSSLRQAAGMQPEVRLWASRDKDLSSLKGDKDFESIVHPNE